MTKEYKITTSCTLITEYMMEVRMSEDYRATIDKEVRYYKALEQAEQIIPEWIEAGLTYEELRVLLLEMQLSN
mgnify:CR=1 FL=1